MIAKSIILSIIMIESSGNPMATSPTGAAGLMQMTSIAEKEVCIQYGCPEGYDIYDPETNVLMGYQLLTYYYAEANNNLLGAIAMYHGGYEQYYNFIYRRPLAQETADYILKFKRLRWQYAYFFDSQPVHLSELQPIVDKVLLRLGEEDGATLFDAWL
jgi:soluble lytic murein transglycosylase-like protein